jgi:hypothetical protein
MSLYAVSFVKPCQCVDQSKLLTPVTRALCSLKSRAAYPVPAGRLWGMVLAAESVEFWKQKNQGGPYNIFDTLSKSPSLGNIIKFY